jgi:hypothetical protein
MSKTFLQSELGHVRGNSIHQQRTARSPTPLEALRNAIDRSVKGGGNLAPYV